MVGPCKKGFGSKEDTDNTSNYCNVREIWGNSEGLLNKEYKCGKEMINKGDYFGFPPNQGNVILLLFVCWSEIVLQITQRADALILARFRIGLNILYDIQIRCWIKWLSLV